MKDMQVVTALASIRGLVAGLYGRIDSLGTTGARSVDFAVDMFDRQDLDTLGEYWSDAGAFAIRDETAVLSTGTTNTLALGTVTATLGVNTITGRLNAYGMAGTTLVDSTYAADLTSSDFTCEVAFYSGVASWDFPANEEVGTPLSFYREVTLGSYTFRSYDLATASRDLYSIASQAGVCVANSLGSTYGFGVSMHDAPAVSAAVSYPSGNPPFLTAGLPAANMFRALVGSDGNVRSAPPVEYSSATDTDTSTGGTYLHASAVSASASPILGPGFHVARVVCSGSSVTMTVDGVVMFTGTPPSVAAKSRTRAGIMAPTGSVIAAMTALNRMANGGIKSFAVWRNDMPTPPAQSGHGRYVDGAFVYTDKYHDPIVDGAGAITGYTYDPEA